MPSQIVDRLGSEAKSAVGNDATRRRWLGRLVLYAIVSFAVSFAIEIFAVPILGQSDIDVRSAWSDLRRILRALVDGDVAAWFWCAVPPAVVTLVQCVFLLPLFRPPEPTDRPKSLRQSARLAAFIGACSAAALAWALLELASYNQNAFDRFGTAVFFGTPIMALLPAWFAWSWVLIRRSERADPLGLDRMLAPLLVGTALSVAMIIPIDALIRKKKSCYCGTGSFFALCIGLASLVWFLGPCALLALGRQRRRWARRNACVGCGYARVRGIAGGSVRGSGAHCPECGRGWTKRRATAASRATRSAVSGHCQESRFLEDK
ncbi:MAG: hypothetical protein SGJ09_02290 [Phycisphaerae bacterium]|nr:hypothetical protein [Phycisphaerae bacterium]